MIRATDDPGIRYQLAARRRRLEAVLARAQGETYLMDLLEEVDAALERLDAGVYGLCETCHDTIERDRLTSNPLLRFCLDHMEEAERRALEHDLATSASVQAALLPKNDIGSAGWTASYHYAPAGAVSGDYCDLIPGDDSFLILLGDVAGKGVSASILMSHLHAIFRSLSTLDLPLDQLLERANRTFCDSTMPNYYATLVCARGHGSGLLEIANAGHCSPFVVRAGGVETLEATGLPLGMFCGGRYEVRRLGLVSGDRVVLYTDGLSEARRGDGQEYGVQRLRNLLLKETAAGARETTRICVRDVEEFLAGAHNGDDLTVMAVQRE